MKERSKEIRGEVFYSTNREKGNGICKKNMGKHTPFHSLLFLSLWGHGGRVGLVLGGLLPSDGLLLVYFPSARLVCSFNK